MWELDHKEGWVLKNWCFWIVVLEKVKVKITQSCRTLWDPMDCSLPGSCVREILQARVLEWVAYPFSRGSSWCRIRTSISCIAGRFFTPWATRGALGEDPLNPLDTKEIKPINPKGNQPWIVIGSTEAEAEAPVLWPPDANSWLTGKNPDVGKDWGQEEKGATVNEMVGWHHRLNGHEFEQTLGVSERQGRLACTVHGVANSWIWPSDWTLCWVSADSASYAPISRPPYRQANTWDFSQLWPFREVYSGTSLSAFPWS